MKGNFSFLKTKTLFSRMALDQLHEQNNKVIKGVSGATSLLNREDESALNRWALCGPDLSRMMEEFEDEYQSKNPNSAEPNKHHELSASFQSDFFSDVQKLYASFMNNPFQLQQLTVVTNTDMVFDDNIFHNISSLESTGTSQLNTFTKDRLIMCKVSIRAKITLNHFILPGDEKSKKSRGTTPDKRLTSQFLTKLRAAVRYRREHALKLFQTEIFGTSQCLSVNSETLYHGTKSSIIQRIEKTERPAAVPSSALIIDFSGLIRISFNATTFLDYCQKIYRHIMEMANDFGRVDVICDRYFENSLKNQTRQDRGCGSVFIFDENTKFPSDFKENFLKHNDNKERFNSFIAKKLLEIHRGSKTLVVTKGNSINTNENTLESSPLINSCTAEEADQKLVRHMLQCVQTGVKKVVVKTVDSDVVMSLLAYRHKAGNLLDSNVYAWFGVGTSACYFNINTIALELGENRCKALPFFHTFTGCDTVSSFFNQGKCKFWDRWEEFDEVDKLTRVFAELSAKPTTLLSEQINVLERFILYVYYGKCTGDDIDVQRMREFEHSTHSNLQLLPPSKNGLLEHLKRAAYEAGWVVYQCIENVELPDPQNWGWKRIGNGRFVPQWQLCDNPIDPITVVTNTCMCVTAKCNNCTCSKLALDCLPFCKCQRGCLYKSI